MTEDLWLTSQDPAAMLGWLGGPYPGGISGTDGEGKPYAHKVTERRLRLFAVACCRQVWSLLSYQSRKAVRMAEREADDHAVRLEVPWLDWRDGTANSEPWLRDWSPCASNAHEAADRCVWNPSRPEHAADILRSIFGNPWCPVTLKAKCEECNGRGGKPCDQSDQWYSCRACDGTGKVGQFDPAWLTPQVATLAASAYEDRQADGTLDPVTLAALADALIEAGCPESVGGTEVVEHCGAFMYGCEELGTMDTCTHKVKTERKVLAPHPVLAQLRDPGPLYRGAWSLDLLTGRE